MPFPFHVYPRIPTLKSQDMMRINSVKFFKGDKTRWPGLLWLGYDSQNQTSSCPSGHSKGGTCHKRTTSFGFILFGEQRTARRSCKKKFVGKYSTISGKKRNGRDIISIRLMESPTTFIVCSCFSLGIQSARLSTN